MAANLLIAFKNNANRLNFLVCMLCKIFVVFVSLRSLLSGYFYTVHRESSLGPSN